MHQSTAPLPSRRWLQVLEVQEALDAQKEEFERREELFKQREEQVARGAQVLLDAVLDLAG